VLEALLQSLDLRGKTFRVCLQLLESVLQTVKGFFRGVNSMFASLGYSFA
ncbi:hypothetical protein A2U01_0094723, partial [Trifolium medium]|nr:hypothetical protein [Trifolium medium]